MLQRFLFSFLCHFFGRAKGSCNGPPPRGQRTANGLHLALILVVFFFCLFITRVRPIEIMARLCTVCFLSAVRAVEARCKHPFALRPGLSQDDLMRTKEITKEVEVPSGRDGQKKDKRTRSPPPIPLLQTP